TALLVLGIVGATVTATSLWPPYRPGVVAIAAFFPGWLVSELPLHFALLELGLAGLLAITGGVHGTADLVGLALIAASLLVLLPQLRLATAPTLVLERALKAGLGNDYHDRIDAELRRAYDPTTSWSQLALIWPRRPHHLDRLCDIEYARID